MNWIEEIESELRRSIPNENPGRTRTIARRAAGIALEKYYKNSNANYFALVQFAATDSKLPNSVQTAAERLSGKITGTFQAPSEFPLDDAAIIIEFVRKYLLQSNKTL